MMAVTRPAAWATRVDLTLAEALIDLRAGRDQEVVERLGQPARTRIYEGRELPEMVTYASRWIVSEAWERLGRIDSSAQPDQDRFKTILSDIVSRAEDQSGIDPGESIHGFDFAHRNGSHRD